MIAINSFACADERVDECCVLGFEGPAEVNPATVSAQWGENARVSRSRACVLKCEGNGN